MFGKLLLCFVVFLASLYFVMIQLLNYPQSQVQSHKGACLKNLLIDLEQEDTASFYNIQGFRCGYKAIVSDFSQLKNQIGREIENSKGTFLNIRTGKYTFFYTSKVNDRSFDHYFK